MRIQKSFQDYIRSDSSAGLVTEGLLGNRYVDIDRGFVGRPLTNDEEIRGREENALKDVVDRSADLLTNLNTITKQAGDVLTEIKEGKGSLGKFLVDEDAYNHLDSSLENFDHMMADIQAGKGTLGNWSRTRKCTTVWIRSRAVWTTCSKPCRSRRARSASWFMSTDFHDSAKNFLDNGNAVLKDVRAGKGTLGKLATDDSLYNQYRQVGENLSSATAKMDSNETTIGKFFTDPKLYDNLSGLTGDMRLLVGDFRKDPKKFLHVKFSIF